MYKRTLKKIGLLFLFILTFVIVWPDDEDIYIPKDVNDAVNHLIVTHQSDFLEIAKSKTEKEFANGEHFSLGLWIRNNWKLWEGSNLCEYFKDLGIHHPDDMSAIIIHSLWRKLNDQPIKLEEQVQCYKDYWREQERLKEQYGDEKGFPVPNFTCPNRDTHYEKLPDNPKKEERSNSSLKQPD